MMRYDGTTSLCGVRVMKSDQFFCALGDIDELDAVISMTTLNKFELRTIHTALDMARTELCEFGKECASFDAIVLLLEHWTSNKKNQGIFNFARAVCRRAERSVVALGPRVNNVAMFLNTLDKYLYAEA